MTDFHCGLLNLVVGLYFFKIKWIGQCKQKTFFFSSSLEIGNSKVCCLSYTPRAFLDANSWRSVNWDLFCFSQIALKGQTKTLWLAGTPSDQHWNVLPESELLNYLITLNKITTALRANLLFHSLLKKGVSVMFLYMRAKNKS